MRDLTFRCHLRSAGSERDLSGLYDRRKPGRIRERKFASQRRSRDAVGANVPLTRFRMRLIRRRHTNGSSPITNSAEFTAYGELQSRWGTAIIIFWRLQNSSHWSYARKASFGKPPLGYPRNKSDRLFFELIRNNGGTPVNRGWPNCTVFGKDDQLEAFVEVKPIKARRWACDIKVEIKQPAG